MCVWGSLDVFSLGKTDQGLPKTDKDLVCGVKKIEDLNGDDEGGCNSGPSPNWKKRRDNHGHLTLTDCLENDILESYIENCRWGPED